MAALRVEQYPYSADSSEHFIRVHFPVSSSEDEETPYAVVFIIHGGYWKNKYSIVNAATDTMAPAFAQARYIAIEVEYRRSDHEGGGWPGTNHDVAAAFESLPGVLKQAGLSFDPSKVAVVGHSAGGTLALWLAHHTEKIKSDFAPSHIVALAPVTDLKRGYEENISSEGDAVELYMKSTPESQPSHYDNASPIEHLPLSVPTLIIYGLKDEDVPLNQAIGYCEAATRVGSKIEILELPEANHYDLTNAGGGHYGWPKSCVWDEILSTIGSFMHVG